MEKDRKLRFAIIFALCFSIVSISMAYAAFEAMLEVRTETYLEGSNWSIKFLNLSEPTITGNATEKNSPTITATNINLDISLLNINDSISYTFDVKNEGTINAKLNAEPIVSGIPSDLMNNISYVITHEDGTAVLANELLNVGDTKSMKITITYLDNEITQNSTNFTISSIFLYVQA